VNIIILHSHLESFSKFDFSTAFDQIILHGFIDTLKIIPFLFLSYLFMEWLEHRKNASSLVLLKNTKKAGPLFAALLGSVPQCGFSGAASGLFSARVISVGTLLAVFLSTSDEMLPVLIAGKMKISQIAIIVLYKVVVGIIIGFSVDFLLRVLKKEHKDGEHIHAICESEGCHCEKGIWHSAVHHTLSVGTFLLIITVLINSLVYFVGSDALENSVLSLSFAGHFLSAILGLIPNCAISVLLADFYLRGFISAGVMLSGLFSGAGVGLLVLLKTNKNHKENLCIIAILLVSAFVFGMMFDLIPIF
jgi:hypothetical protein